MDRSTALAGAIRFWAAQWGVLPYQQPVSFVILAGPRSGSTLLQTTLDQHPNVVCLHELAREKLKPTHFYRHFLGMRKNLCDLRKTDPSAFLNRIFNARQPRQVGALGFKALYTQPSHGSGDWRLFWTSLGQVPGLRVVHLQRNRVEGIVSMKLAMETKRWISGHYEIPPLVLDCEWLLDQLRRLATLEDAACRTLSKGPMLRVRYLDLVGDPQGVCDGIFEFLGLSSQPVKLAIRKQRSQDLPETIANWKQVVARVADSEFAVELDGLH